MFQLAVAAGLLATQLVAGQGQWPSWVPSQARDMFGELDDVAVTSKDAAFGEEACDIRMKLLKALGPVTGPEKGQIMMQVLSDLGHCDLKAGKVTSALRRFQSAISELNAPNEDMLMQQPQFAPVVLMRQACDYVQKKAVSRAALELRRVRTIFHRERSKMLKNVAKQNKVPDGQIDSFIENIMEKANAGGKEAQQVKGLVKTLNTFDGMMQNVENQIKTIETTVGGDGEAATKRRKRLSMGSGPHLQGILMEPQIEAENLVVAEALAEKATSIAKEINEAKLTATASLIKRSKEASGCKDLPETCATVKGLPDLATNGFGETRVLALKKGKNQVLDMCETNGNVLVLLPTSSGVKLTIDGGEAQELEAASVTVADHCLPLTLKTDEAAFVLLAQVWHPEVASIERTTAARESGPSKWGLKEDEVKKISADINAYGKKGWDAAVKKWVAGPVFGRLQAKLNEQADAERAVKDAAEAAATEKARNEDTDRQKNLEELEKKRAEKKALAEGKENKRLEAKRKMEEERAKLDPWLNDPAVREEERKLADLKEQRRDASSKLEFDLTNQLTQEINAQERAVKKMINKARKAHKKGKKLGDGKTVDPSKKGQEEGAAPEAADEGSEKLAAFKKQLAAAEKKLADVKEQKTKAAEEENYALAKKLKKEQENLEKEVNALKSKSEL